MSKYTAAGFIAAAATKTPLILTGTAAQRGWISYFRLSATGTPATDVNAEVQVRRSTAAGTSTAYTPIAIDLADPAAVVIAGVNATIEPTYSAGFIDDVFFNPRAVVPWSAYDQASELVIPATAAAGIGFQCAAAGGIGTNVNAAVAFHQ
ncbi:MAG TPA: hypothetical protein VIM74_07275 [Casimicrobiaceae bacterium]|jgi:hypothetical protein